MTNHPKQSRVIVNREGEKIIPYTTADMVWTSTGQKLSNFIKTAHLVYSNGGWREDYFVYKNGLVQYYCSITNNTKKSLKAPTPKIPCNGQPIWAIAGPSYSWGGGTQSSPYDWAYTHVQLQGYCVQLKQDADGHVTVVKNVPAVRNFSGSGTDDVPRGDYSFSKFPLYILQIYYADPTWFKNYFGFDRPAIQQLPIIT